MDFAMPERELFQELHCYGFVVPHVPACMCKFPVIRHSAAPVKSFSKKPPSLSSLITQASGLFKLIFKPACIVYVVADA